MSIGDVCESSFSCTVVTTNSNTNQSGMRVHKFLDSVFEVWDSSIFTFKRQTEPEHEAVTALRGQGN